MPKKKQRQKAKTIKELTLEDVIDLVKNPRPPTSLLRELLEPKDIPDPSNFLSWK